MCVCVYIYIYVYTTTFLNKYNRPILVSPHFFAACNRAGMLCSSAFTASRPVGHLCSHNAATSQTKPKVWLEWLERATWMDQSSEVWKFFLGFLWGYHVFYGISYADIMEFLYIYRYHEFSMWWYDGYVLWEARWDIIWSDITGRWIELIVGI